MKSFLFLCCFFLVGSLSAQQSETHQSLHVLACELPLDLSKVNLKDTKNIVQISEGKIGAIEKVIHDFRMREWGDLPEQYSTDDCYVGTLWLKGGPETLYYIILQHPVTKDLKAKILFLEKNKVIEQNLFAMYSLDGPGFKKSELFEMLDIEAPQVQLSEVDGDGIEEYTFSRLYHNGTFNALETLIMNVQEPKADTLHFSRKWID